MGQIETTWPISEVRLKRHGQVPAVTCFEAKGYMCTILRSRVACLLTSWRNANGLTLETVEEDLRLALSRAGLSEGHLWVLSASGRRHFGLEDESDGYLELTAREFALIGSSYRIPLDYLEALRAPISSGPFLLVESDRLLASAQLPGMKTLTPKGFLRCAPRVFVQFLELDQMVRSPTYRHAGHADVFVLSGTVFVTDCDSGCRFSVRKLECLQFQTCGGYYFENAGESKAHVLIVRRCSRREVEYQQQMLTRACERTKKLGSVMTKTIRSLSCYATPEPKTTTGLPKQVNDPIGLGWLLTQVSRSAFRHPDRALSLNSLYEISRSLDLPFSRSYFHRLQNGVCRPDASELPHLARAYEIQPLLLLDYLYPTSSAAVQFQFSGDFGGLVQAPVEYSPKGSKYQVARRRLAHSPVSMSFVRLDARGATSFNRHPGSELIIPLAGKLRIDFTDMHAQLNANDCLLVHFDSSERHCVRNVSRKEGRFIAVRLYAG